MAQPNEMLVRLGERLRALRTERALTLRELGDRAGVSARFLVSLEAGKANVSVVRLEEIARALGSSASGVLGGQAPTEHQSERLVALLGLRGAGKTAVGSRAAERMGVPFFELDRLVSDRAGMSLESIFSLHGVDYYRRLEARELDQLLASGRGGILATAGGIVTHHASYGRLRRAAVTVWLKAKAEDHWDRVVAQGDVRPMADRRDAMSELRAILRARRALYEQADHVVDTSALGFERSVDAVVRIARDAG